MLNYWTEKDIQLLKDNYASKTKEELLRLFPDRTWSSILTKANKININKRVSWTKEEDALLEKIYDKVSMSEVCSIFSNRTYDGIIHRAQKLNLNSYDHPIWTDSQKEYLILNWDKYPDIILANELHKTRVAVKRMRNLLGLHRQNKSQRTYENITKFIRGNIYEWKLNSMIACDYKCVITGDKQFEIHHKYPVNKIIDKVFSENGFEYKCFDSYTESELDCILSKFLEEQNKYPLGDCVRKDIHQMFHHLYGQYNVTVEQWEQFKKDYMNGVYDNYKINIIA